METTVTAAVEPGGRAVDVRIRALSSDGSGVGDLPDGPVVFVHRTAPDDHARIRIRRRKERWARGVLEKIVEPGGARAEPPCPHYAACGGCTLQHIPYADQLRWKARFVRDALTRIGGTDAVVSGPLPSPLELGYRSRVTFTMLRLGGERVVAGLRALERPERIVDVPRACAIADPAINDAWLRLRAEWGPGARYLPAGRELRLTLMRSSEGVVLLVGGGQGKGSLEALVGPETGIVAAWREDRDGRVRLIAGETPTVELRAGESVPVDPRVFLQVNAQAAERLQRAVLGALPEPRGMTIVDAYCGAGQYGRPLARAGADVVGIEADEVAASAATRDAPEGFRVLEGRVETRLPEALPADAVIVNPPRRGLAPAVSEILGVRPVARLVYVSCDPATLARDVRRLAGAYRIDEVQAFDLFPQTAHVETMVTLRHRDSSE